RTYNISDSMLQQFSLFDDRIPGWQIWSAGAAIPTTYGKLISSVGNEKIYEYSFVIPKNFNSTSPQQYQNIFGGKHYRVLITAVVSGIAGTSSSVSVDDYSDGLFSIEPNDTCVDSDGGKNYYTKGSVTEINQYTNWAPNTFPDMCVADNILGNLAEATCAQHSDGTYYGKQIYYTCPFGCSNGACLPAPSVTVLSPSGSTLVQKQQTTITWKTQNYSGLVGLDLYQNDNFIVNIVTNISDTGYYIWTVPITLSGSGFKIKAVLLNTKAGSVADFSDTPFNIIAQPVPNCTDSDGGKDYYVKGTVKINNTSYIDYCSGSVLLEYSCPSQQDSSTGIYSAVNVDPYVCVNGCENGACKKTSDCSYRYWYDDTSKVCGYKQFCGTYIYNGLKTFTTKEACESSLESIGCLNVITYAKNPSTGECRVHLNSCGILPGWVKVDSCPTSTQPITQNSQLSILYASLFQLLEELELLKK
ncbi:MAG: hypothetical protein PHV47_01360, partial [Candidatus Pacebacteria bacterium]|nr:hypothetical protein [Candidatus Paceibacterota bacterium]